MINSYLNFSLAIPRGGLRDGLEMEGCLVVMLGGGRLEVPWDSFVFRE